MPALNVKTRWVLGLLAVTALLAKPAYDYHLARQARAAAQARYAADKAEFQRLCRDVAGYKFYRKAENVEGVLLLKVRHTGDWQDLMAPGAAFALEGTDEEYITSFLEYRYPSSGVNDESYFSSTKRKEGAIPGFSYVDVIDEKTGKRYRRTGSEKAVGKKDTSAHEVKRRLAEDPNYDLNVYQWTLDSVIAPDPPPRYAVTFEDHVIPEERARGLASSTVKVIDTQTNEVMAEMLRYAWGARQASSANPYPWLTAYKCPGVGHGASAATRQFVDRVLVPPGATAPPFPPPRHENRR
ncbi:hypothetical protein GCM10025771_18010 [Niveibacterium umoris]|uniref:Uncharacterized protein n=1 Tax=Niveibacterium umoris TaxID=1193620 RepID=A0A840BJ53_9RHOO|nr:hypothetical protein [Niveibacterium umoris]MBB4013010.1 hypothetical protein [Niveibacterium umoris]